MERETLRALLAWRIGGTWTDDAISSVPAVARVFSPIDGLTLRLRCGALEGETYFVASVRGHATIRMSNGDVIGSAPICCSGDGPCAYALLVELRAEAARQVVAVLARTHRVDPKLTVRYRQLADSREW